MARSIWVVVSRLGVIGLEEMLSSRALAYLSSPKNVLLTYDDTWHRLWTYCATDK